MREEAWRRDFPDLPHEPQDLDLVRRHLSWTPAQCLANLRRVVAFVRRARAGTWRPITAELKPPPAPDDA
jgi:hypothetical protein